MAMTLRLDEELTERLRVQADAEKRSMQTLVAIAVSEYLDRNSKRQLIDKALDISMDRYAGMLDRLSK